MKQHGFTLLELIIVMAIIGTLVTIATMNFRTMTVKSNVEGQIKQMYSDLMTVRIEAMDRNTYHFVTLNANQYTVKEDTDNNGVDDASDAKLLQTTMTNAILFNGATPANVDLIFDNRGLATVTGTISVPNTAAAAFDCILIETTRTSMGAMSGGSCVPK